MMDGKDKPEIDEMWQFINNIIRPSELVPDKASLTNEQLFLVYSKLSDIDEMFRDIAQIKNLQNGIDKEKEKLLIV
jgi:hypothetical protein